MYKSNQSPAVGNLLSLTVLTEPPTALSKLHHQTEVHGLLPPPLQDGQVEDRANSTQPTYRAALQNTSQKSLGCKMPMHLW